MSGNGPPCAFHDQSMETLRSIMLDIKEQMREGLAALKEQAKSFSETMSRVVESQTTRQALCARQDQRIANLEQNQAQHREAHAKDREEYLKERADMWTAVNKLRFHVYVGLGIGLVLQLLAPFIIGALLKAG